MRDMVPFHISYHKYFLYLLVLFFHEFNSDTVRKWHVATCTATQQATPGPVHLKFKVPIHAVMIVVEIHTVVGLQECLHRCRKKIC